MIAVLRVTLFVAVMCVESGCACCGVKADICVFLAVQRHKSSAEALCGQPHDNQPEDGFTPDVHEINSMRSCSK